VSAMAFGGGRPNDRMGRPPPLLPPMNGNRRKAASSCGPSNVIRRRAGREASSGPQTTRGPSSPSQRNGSLRGPPLLNGTQHVRLQVRPPPGTSGPRPTSHPCGAGAVHAHVPRTHPCTHVARASQPAAVAVQPRIAFPPQAVLPFAVGASTAAVAFVAAVARNLCPVRGAITLRAAHVACPGAD
jgi:hypothetical protein